MTPEQRRSHPPSAPGFLLGAHGLQFSPWGQLFQPGHQDRFCDILGRRTRSTPSRKSATTEQGSTSWGRLTALMTSRCPPVKEADPCCRWEPRICNVPSSTWMPTCSRSQPGRSTLRRYCRGSSDTAMGVSNRLNDGLVNMVAMLLEGFRNSGCLNQAAISEPEPERGARIRERNSVGDSLAMRRKLRLKCDRLWKPTS